MKETNKTDISRRKLLKGAGVSVVAGAATLTSPAIKANEDKSIAPRWGMVMDLRKCIGCRACTVACKSENGVSLGRFRTVVQENTWGTFPKAKKAFLPLMCNHCEGNKEDGVPPCVKVCPEFPAGRAKFKMPDGSTKRYPTGATYKRPDGLILIDKSKCIGCGKCIDACPYGVRSFDPFTKAGKEPTKQAADKCDMCTHRVENGVEPSCANTCQGRARVFGDLNDPNSEVSKLVKEHNLADSVLLKEEGTHPQVFYIDPDNTLKHVYKKREEKNLDHFVDQIT